MDQSSLNIFLTKLRFLFRHELQESLEEGYKAEYLSDNGAMHSDYCQASHNLLSSSVNIL